MINKCPICRREKENVGPKIIGKTKSEDRRLPLPNEALITKVMCQDCYDSLKASRQRCNF